jgi:hypothetical integral membrane protein (TIGR02206 family)
MMANTSYFDLFGRDHLLTMLLILVACVALPLIVRRARSTGIERSVAATLCIVLLLNEALKFAARILVYKLPVEEQLPLHLCAATAFLVAYMLMRRSYAVFEVAYFWAMGGTLQAILTPDLQAPFPSLYYMVFFFGHGVVMLGVAYAIVVFRFRPTLKSIVKAMAALAAYATVIAPLNWLLGTNYLYLCHKPAGTSLIDYLAPWPWYIASLGLIAAVSFVIWWLPFGLLKLRSRQS